MKLVRITEIARCDGFYGSKYVQEILDRKWVVVEEWKCQYDHDYVGMKANPHLLMPEDRGYFTWCFRGVKYEVIYDDEAQPAAECEQS